MLLRPLIVPLLGAGLAAACADSTLDETSGEDEEDLPGEEDDPGEEPQPMADCAELGWEGDHCQPTQYPIVLVHGFNAAPGSIWSFYEVAPLLEADGHRVFEPAVEPFRGVASRAETLGHAIDAVLAETGATKVNIVGHSMGGLDARYLVATLGYGDRVASISTIGTPHEGTYIADLVDWLPSFADDALDALAGLIGRTYSDLADDPDVRQVMRDLSEEMAPDFNAANPDHPGVYYQSWAGVSSVLGRVTDDDSVACEDRWAAMPEGGTGDGDSMSWLLVPMTAFVGHGVAGWTEPNDGTVMVESAKWGTFRGCYLADHLDLIGQVGATEPIERTGFDHRFFYRDLAFDLASRGF